MTADHLRKESEKIVYGGLNRSECLKLLAEAANEIERLQLPSDRWPVVREQDGYKIGACPLCGAEHVVGDSE